MSDPALVDRAVAGARGQTNFPRTAHWTEYAVAQGDAGLALMYGQLDRCWPGAGWDVTAHDYLAAAVRAAEGMSLPLGAFSGLAGLGFVAQLLGRDGARYQRLTAAVEAELVPRALAFAGSVKGRDGGLSVSEFDAVSGLAGLGACLLAGRHRAAMDRACRQVLESLVALVVEPTAVPRWFTPSELIPDEKTAAAYPDGNLNCGLAHGIPGPLAVMALALEAGGGDMEGLRRAAADAADWLAAHRCYDAWGVNWPTVVTLPDPPVVPDAPSRAAWCYGSPGVARSLWLAGRALGDGALMALSVEAMRAVYRRPRPVRNIESPTFCHGVAGLLQVTLRFWHDTGIDDFARAAADLVGQLLESYDPDDALLGFRHLEHGGNAVDQPGLLDGAPGVSLVLLAAGTDVEPVWDRLFLLS